MSVSTQHLRYPNVLVAIDADAVSNPIHAVDFKTIKAALQMDASADFTIHVYGSYNPITNPPDFSSPVSADNEYHELQYVNEIDGATYNSASPFNPVTNSDLVAAFNIETSGVVWVGFAVEDYSAGTLEKLDVVLLSNFN